MSTVLEVAGLAALTVGLFLVLTVGVALVASGGVVFVYAQTLNDGSIAETFARLVAPRAKKR